MKKYRGVLLTAVFFLIFTAAITQPALADDPIKKMGRGFTNILEGPFELYTQFVLMPKSTDPGFNVIAGGTRGFWMMLAREMVGIYDVATFLIPVPWGYKPLIQPATTFTDWDIRKPQDHPNEPPPLIAEQQKRF